MPEIKCMTVSELVAELNLIIVNGGSDKKVYLSVKDGPISTVKKCKGIITTRMFNNIYLTTENEDGRISNCN